MRLRAYPLFVTVPAFDAYALFTFTVVGLPLRYLRLVAVVVVPLYVSPVHIHRYRDGLNTTPIYVATSLLPYSVTLLPLPVIRIQFCLFEFVGLRSFVSWFVAVPFGLRCTFGFSFTLFTLPVARLRAVCRLRYCVTFTFARLLRLPRCRLPRVAWRSLRYPDAHVTLRVPLLPPVPVTCLAFPFLPSR